MVKTPTEYNLSPQRGLLAAFIVLPLLVAAAWFVINAQFASWDFRNNLWGPAHLLVQGMSPYLIEQLFDNSNSVWLPMAIGVGFWLGYLDLFTATNLWALLSAVLAILLTLISIQRGQPGTLWVTVALLAVFLFPPTVSHFILGQFSLISVVLLLIAVRVVERSFHWSIIVGLLLALALTKPQLVLLPSLGIALMYWKNRGVKGTFQVGVLTLGWSLLLMLPLWLGYPNWVEGFQVALARNMVWAHPTLFVQFYWWMGDTGRLAWGLLVIVMVAVNGWLWWHLPARRAVSWSLALNLLITPYAWSWDFVLLLPLFVQTLFSLQAYSLRGMLLAGYCLCWAGVVHIRLNTENDDVRYWWAPLFLLFVILTVQIIATYLQAHQHRKSIPNTVTISPEAH
jgi:hypothetical protein